MSLPATLMGMNYCYKPGNFWESPEMNENKIYNRRGSRRIGQTNKL